MKMYLRSGLTLFLLTLLAVSSAVAEKSEENYWDGILTHLKRGNESGAPGSPEVAAARSYMDSLSASELIIGGRQATEDIVSRTDPNMCGLVYLQNMVWFEILYPQKTEGLSDVEPLLQEMQNAELPPDWRWYVSYLLTDPWSEKELLNDEQRRKISQTLLSVLEREDEHPAVVAGAAEGLPQTLAALKEDLPPAEEAKERRDALRALTGLSERYLKTAVALVSDPETDAAVLRATLGGLVRVAELGVAETDAVRAALRKAARNFASYPEDIWPRLMLAAVKLGAEADFEKLLAEASDAAEQEQVAERLGAVRSLLDKTQVAAARKDDKESDTKASPVRRLSDCSPAELLVMARHRADLLAQGRVGEGAWSELSAILQEYESRPEPR